MTAQSAFEHEVIGVLRGLVDAVGHMLYRTPDAAYHIVFLDENDELVNPRIENRLQLEAEGKIRRVSTGAWHHTEAVRLHANVTESLDALRPSNNQEGEAE